MPSSFTRCHYEIPETQDQCNTWFEKLADEVLCPIHAGIISPDAAVKHAETKANYLQSVNEEHAICAKMTLEDLDIHINRLEAVIELERTKLLAARATRSQKIETLSDDERAERRKQKISKAVFNLENPKVKKEKIIKEKKSTLKDDPIKYMMQQYHMTEEQAKGMLGL